MNQKESKNKRIGYITIAVALISYSMMVFEITLTRIFSVMLSYHFVFIILSFALLGLGFGGLLLKKWFRFFPMSSLSTNATVSAYAIGLITLLVVKLPVYDFTNLGELSIWIYVLLAAIPFFFIGLTLAGVFQEFPARSSMIYGFDLIGATVGTLFVVPLLNQFGAINVALLTALVTSLAALIIGWYERKIKISTYISTVFALLLIIILNSQTANTTVPLTPDINKDMNRILKNPYDRAEIVESRWSAFGRTDLVRSAFSPNEMILFVDGAAGSAMYNFNAIRKDSSELTHLVYHFGEYFPFFFLEEPEKENAFIIGPGGGRDVVIALLGGVKKITAVEVNPEVVQIVKDYEKFNGGIYTTHPDVKVVVQEARNYLRSSKERYDLIMAALPITKSSRSVEGYALTENYLFTVEAMKDYLEHLTPEGRIVIVAHNNAEIYKTILLTLTALEETGINSSDAMNHIYTIASGMMPTIVIKKQPFDSLAIDVRHKAIHQLGYDRGNFYVPYTKQITFPAEERLGISNEWRMFDQILIDISAGKLSPQQLSESSVIDISPVTDDRPFFYKFEAGLPRPFGLLSVLIILSLVFLLFPFLIKNRSKIIENKLIKSFADHPRLKIFLPIFFLTGSGFMLLEIAFLQKLTLYIGHPVLALTALLFSVLLGTGVGSLLSGLIKEKLYYSIALSAILIFILSLIYNWLLPSLFNLAEDPQILAYFILIPMGVLLGFPFPLAIRLMKEYDLAEFVNMMWGVNGIASVIGSTLTMIVGILLGFSYAVILGAVLYLILSVLAITLPKFKSIQTS